MSSVLSVVPSNQEGLYLFAKLLWRSLPVRRDPLPVEVQQNIDLDAFRPRNTGTTKIQLRKGTKAEEMEPLSRIIHDLNKRFGTDFTEQDKVFIQQLEHRLAGDPALEASIKVNPPEDARLTFNQIVNDRLQEMMDSNFKFYRQITDNADFAEDLLAWMLERYRKTKKR